MNKTKFSAVSLEPGLCDQFLEREVEIQLKFKHSLEKEKSQSRYILVMADYEYSIWEDLLKKQQEDSVIVLLLGSETINLKVAVSLIRMKSINHVLMQYYTKPQFGRACLSTLYFLVEFRRVLSKKKLWIIFKRGAKRYIKLSYLRKVSMGKISYLPLGYTTKFANQFLDLFSVDEFPKNKKSIIQFSLFFDEVTKSQNICFRGAKSGPLRQVMFADDYTPFNFVPVILNDNWSGGVSKDNSYLRDLLISKYSLNPPGHVSNETFRFCEALICTCVPLSTNCSILDWSNSKLTLPIYSVFHPSSYKKQLFKAVNLDEKARREVITKTISNYLESLKETKKLIKELMR